MPVIIFFSAIILLSFSVKLFFLIAPQIGGKAKGKRLEIIKRSNNYCEGKFHNTVKTDMNIPPAIMLKIAEKMLNTGSKNEPKEVIRTIPFQKEKFLGYQKNDIAISWFGHSSCILKMEGMVLLVDPMFSERASMFSFIGPKRFNYTNFVTVKDLPKIDTVILTHDHYDHLDYETFLQLKGWVGQYIVPLGVGAHLERWGISAEQIKELDWWDSFSLNQELTLTCTPSRHFSGRGLTRFETLWCSYVLAGKNKKIYLGGDSGFYPGFKDIGDKLGPFDLTLLECGAYNENWKNIHILPEDTIQAHLDLKGSVLMPIHWGKFNLAMHHWKDPVKRLLSKAKEQEVKVIFPEIGEIFSLVKLPEGKWWEKYQ